MKSKLAYSLSFIFNVVLLILAIYHFRRRVVLNQQLAKSAKNRFSLVYAAVAILMASFSYEYIALAYEFYGVSVDHGHAGIAYLTSGLINMTIGIVGIIIGRILISWNIIE